MPQWRQRTRARAAWRLAAAICVIASVTASSAAAAAPVRRGPQGLAFYTPKQRLTGRGHGGPIWARPDTGASTLAAARSNDLVLYRSIGVRGRPVPVSGIVSVPRGRAPRGGWPVITFATGTTGIADSCAPSREGRGNGADEYLGLLHPVLDRWLRAGYAVVRTDYEGLATPGDQPYAVGSSEARTTLDVVRAARRLDPALGRRVVVAGHSQGGHAALFAAALAPRWTPELQVVGALAIAPQSHLSEQGAAIRAIHEPSALSSYAALAIRGLAVANPRFHIARLLSDRAAALFPQTLTRCGAELARQDSYGGVAPADLFKSDADLTPVVDALRVSDPERLRIRTPLMIQHGSDDTVIFRAFSDQLVPELRKRGAHVIYRTYDGADHHTVLVAGAHDALAWLHARFGPARPR